jgi:hypothetical protein
MIVYGHDVYTGFDTSKPRYLHSEYSDIMAMDVKNLYGHIPYFSYCAIRAVENDIYVDEKHTGLSASVGFIQYISRLIIHEADVVTVSYYGDDVISNLLTRHDG